ncbi:MAG: hypothetical protein Q4D81_06930 [Eubacteriales bacterium]|nr:hypothetical protein [Eubacteriales bacterium]
MISRDPDGSIHIESEAIPLYDLNRETFEKGIEVHNCLLRENPAMDYLLDDRKIYPLYAEMEDRYLAVWEQHTVSVFDTSSGERVFYREAGPDIALDDSLSLHVFEADEYLFFTGKTGFCLDTKEWEIKCDIPYLAKVTDDWIVTQEEDTITQYPKYTLKDIIQAGKEYIIVSE